jgi:hypothetical protein
VRLDGDSSLAVDELDDDSLRLHLNYGSANVRVINADVLAGFELSTPNGLVRLQEPGRLRVDAERVRGTTVVNVFDGVALVADRGSQLIVRAGKRAEISDDDVRTGLAVRDGFDDWALQRDRRDDNATSVRYVTSEMTGYEDLDQYGVWRDDPEYGPLWLPGTVGADWAPYRDGSWTWIAPWGWTWIDNAPWGYAPFHYGRWVHVGRRWAWAPGRHIGRPVWAPALVGWVGGGGGWFANLGAGHGHRPLPAQGWYPLSPRDPFVPGYRLSHDHLQRINRHARPHGDDGKRGRDGHDGHRQGLTVVPHDQFGNRGSFAVRNAPKAAVPALALQNAPGEAPPAPQGAARRDGRGDRFERDADRAQWPAVRAGAASAGGHAGAADNHRTAGAAARPRRRRHPSAATDAARLEDRGQRQPPPAAGAPVPVPAAGQRFGRRDGSDFDERRRDGRDVEDRRQRQQSGPLGSAVAAAAAAAAAAAPQAPPPRRFEPAPVFHQQSAPVAAPAPVRISAPRHRPCASPRRRHRRHRPARRYSTSVGAARRPRQHPHGTGTRTGVPPAFGATAGAGTRSRACAGIPPAFGAATGADAGRTGAGATQPGEPGAQARRRGLR